MNGFNLKLSAGQVDRTVFNLKEKVNSKGNLEENFYSMKVLGEDPVKLDFALYLEESGCEDCMMEIMDYIEVRDEGRDSRDKSEFFRELREKYVGAMPNVSGGKVVYGVRGQRGLSFKISDMVSRREEV